MEWLVLDLAETIKKEMPELYTVLCKSSYGSKIALRPTAKQAELVERMQDEGYAEETSGGFFLTRDGVQILSLACRLITEVSRQQSAAR